MKHLKRFNENKEEDIFEIVRDAFYNITDAYPLDITINLEKWYMIASGKAEGCFVEDKSNETFDNAFILVEITKNIKEYTLIDEAIKSFTIINDIIIKSKVSINYLKDDFNFNKLYTFDDDGQFVIAIVLELKENN